MSILRTIAINMASLAGRRPWRRLPVAGFFVSTILFSCSGGIALADPPEDPILGGTGGNTLVAYGANNLSVVESIADLGGGTWEYTYSLKSSDPSNVWFFFVYTSFPTSNHTATPFPLGGNRSDLDVVYAPYDARNIDPTLTEVSSAWYTPFGGSNGIMTGGTGSLSFQADVLDTAPKLFAYETGASGYAGGNSGPGRKSGDGSCIRLHGS